MREFTTLQMSTLDGVNVFRLDGVTFGDKSGVAVSAAGDVDGDGTKDILIGAWKASPMGKGAAGSTYVVYLKRVGGYFPTITSLSTLNGRNGFRIDGEYAADFSGYSLAVGDFDGDRASDFLIGAYQSPRCSSGTYSGSGVAYAVLGNQKKLSSSFNLSSLVGYNGFLYGSCSGSLSGYTVSAGDVNGDSIDDVVIGNREGNSLDIILGRGSFSKWQTYSQ